MTSPTNDEPKRRHQYPVNLELERRRVLLVGGGRVARQKIRTMLTAGAEVTIVAPLVDDRLTEAALTDEQVTIHRRGYERGDIDGQQLVLTCTDDRAVNAQVFADADAAGIWCNSADDPDNCSWTLPSVVRQGDLQLTVSTRGKSPALSMHLRRRFEQEFDARWADLLELLAEVRTEVRAVKGTSEVPGWQEALGTADEAGAIDLVLAGDLRGARQHLRNSLGLIDAASPQGTETAGVAA